jgi:hypothetical protein
VLRDGRRLLVLAFLGLAGALGAAAATGHLVGAWRRLGVTALEPSFADLRAYTSGWECTRDGIDVFVANPCDPWGRALVPPRLPESLAFLGLGESSTVPLALAAIALFAVSVLAVAGPISPREALVYAAIVFSPSLLLGVERGNSDLVIFSLLTLVLVTVRHPSAWVRSISYGALLLAAAVKLYPLFAGGVLLRQGLRRAVVGGAAVLVPFGVYLLATLDDLGLIVDNMKRATLLSYGAGVGADGLESAFDVGSGPATAVAVAGVVVMIVAALWLAARIGEPASEPPRDGREARALDAFWMGAGVYLGTFLVGHNFDYKLVALVLTVPQLLRWARSPEPAVPHARWALAALVATLWLSASVPVVPGLSDAWIEAQLRFPFDELLNWFLFVYLAAAIVVTAPPWLRRLRLPVRRPAASPSRVS